MQRVFQSGVVLILAIFVTPIRYLSLKIEVTGKNPAGQNFFFGLDYVKLVPATP